MPRYRRVREDLRESYAVLEGHWIVLHQYVQREEGGMVALRTVMHQILVIRVKIRRPWLIDAFQIGGTSYRPDTSEACIGSRHNIRHLDVVEQPSAIYYYHISTVSLSVFGVPL